MITTYNNIDFQKINPKKCNIRDTVYCHHDVLTLAKNLTHIVKDGKVVEAELNNIKNGESTYEIIANDSISAVFHPFLDIDELDGVNKDTPIEDRITKIIELFDALDDVLLKLSEQGLIIIMWSYTTIISDDETFNEVLNNHNTDIKTNEGERTPITKDISIRLLIINAASEIKQMHLIWKHFIKGYENIIKIDTSVFEIHKRNFKEGDIITCPYRCYRYPMTDKRQTVRNGKKYATTIKRTAVYNSVIYDNGQIQYITLDGILDEFGFNGISVNILDNYDYILYGDINDEEETTGTTGITDTTDTTGEKQEYKKFNDIEEFRNMPLCLYDFKRLFCNYIRFKATDEEINKAEEITKQIFNSREHETHPDYKEWSDEIDKALSNKVNTEGFRYTSLKDKAYNIQILQQIYGFKTKNNFNDFTNYNISNFITDPENKDAVQMFHNLNKWCCRVGGSIYYRNELNKITQYKTDDIISCQPLQYYRGINVKDIFRNLGSFIKLYDGFTMDVNNKNKILLYRLIEPKKTEFLDISFVVNHIKNIICEGNEEIYKLIMTILSYGLFDPCKVAAVPCVFIMKGEHGAGKSTLGDIFYRLSPELTALIKIEDVFGVFNTPIKGKSLIFCDEVDKFKESYNDAIKDFTGKRSITINEKGLKQIETERTQHIFITSNKPIPLYIENGSRRHITVYVEKQEESYYIKLYDIINDERFNYNFINFLREFKNNLTPEYMHTLVQTSERIARQQNNRKIRIDKIESCYRYLILFKKYLKLGIAREAVEILLREYEQEEGDETKNKIKLLKNAIDDNKNGETRRREYRNIEIGGELVKRYQQQIFQLDVDSIKELKRYKDVEYEFLTEPQIITKEGEQLFYTTF